MSPGRFRGRHPLVREPGVREPTEASGHVTRLRSPRRSLCAAVPSLIGQILAYGNSPQVFVYPLLWGSPSFRRVPAFAPSTARGSRFRPAALCPRVPASGSLLFTWFAALRLCHRFGALYVLRRLGKVVQVTLFPLVSASRSRRSANPSYRARAHSSATSCETPPASASTGNSELARNASR
jgi:hypothetical protein